MPAYELAPSLVDLRGEVNRLDPGRDRTSDGWIGDPAHSARVSRHNPDTSRPVPLVRALDIDRDGDEWDDLGTFLAEHLRRRRDPRTNVVIWRGRIFSSYDTRHRKAWQWGPYNGVNAHLSHVHVDVIDGALGARPGTWDLSTAALLEPVVTPPTTRQEDPVDPRLITVEGKPAVALLIGNTWHACQSEQEWRSYASQGVPLLRVTQRVYDTTCAALVRGQ